MRDVFDRISVVSGRLFREDPPLKQPLSAGDYDYRGIVITWVPQLEISSKSAGGIVIASGGPVWLSGGSHYVHGRVQILRDWPGNTRTDFGPDSAGAVMLHEVGHVLGLEHVDDRGAVMYPTTRGASTWSGAERAALRYLQESCA